MRKRRAIKAFGVIIMLLMLTATIVLGGAALLFYLEGSSGAPSVFGYNIYLVRDNDFYQVKARSVAISQKADVNTVNPGEIIIFHRYENNSAQMGHVEKLYKDGEALSLLVITEDMEEIIIPADKYIARVSHYSIILGEIIGFAMSPFGVIAIAVLPCLAMLTYELIRYGGMKSADKRAEAQALTKSGEDSEKSDKKPRKSADKKAKPEENTEEAKQKVKPEEAKPAEKTEETEQAEKPEETEQAANSEEAKQTANSDETADTDNIPQTQETDPERDSSAKETEGSDKPVRKLTDITQIASDLENRAKKRNPSELTIDDILADLDRKK